jgi:hypothetical protein
MVNIIFGIGSICFSLALLPAILKRQPPPSFTCALTAFWLWAFVICYIDLHYTFSTIAGAVTAALWTVLLIQSKTIQKIEKKLI